MTQPAIEGRRLSRRWGAEQTLDGVDLAVHPGEVVALVGLNGAGKSTLMRLLLGMLRPDGGDVTVLGCPVGEAGPSTWRRVGHLVDAPARYGELTARESVYLAARLQGLSREAARRAAADIVQTLELDAWAQRPVRQLSLGNRQRVGIAAALVHRPDVLVLDEPGNALDPLGVVSLRQLLRARAAEDGVAVLVSSHHLDEVARMADRIEVLHRGRLLGRLDPDGTDIEHEFFQRVWRYDADRRRMP